MIGAGPYGLATAGHLLTQGFAVAVFGEPMSFWEQHMPKGMLLRSPYCASNIETPGRFSLDDFQGVTGASVSKPIPVERFIDYGRWLQEHAVPEVDRRRVRTIERQGEGFLLELGDGKQLLSERVVVATGIEAYARRPQEFFDLGDRVSHSVDEPDLGRFAGLKVVVIGGGQSAYESAALLREAGADPEVLVRGPVRLVKSRPWLKKGPMRIFNDPNEIGPPVVSRLVSAPLLFKRFPRRLQDPLAARAIRPVGAIWLRPRVEEIPLTGQIQVRRAAQTTDGVELELSDGSSRRADHVLLATGYQIDISRCSFLSPSLDIDCVNRYPRLGRGFESSIPGLHFVGATAAWSYGPLMRFVAGTGFAASSLAQSLVAGRARSPGVLATQGRQAA